MSRATDALGAASGLGGFELFAITAGVLVAIPVMLGGFAYMYSRHRVFVRGLRGTGVVVEVRPTRVHERYSMVEKPTERVVVATAAVPRGVLTDQKLPVGEYHPGLVVPVVQHPTRPTRLYVDRPDLERSAVMVYSPLALLALLPVYVVAGVTQHVSGG